MNDTTQGNETPEATQGVTPIRTRVEYLESLRGRDIKVYLFGERVDEPVDHPMIRPSINAMAETYELALREPDLATAASPFTGGPVNRFLHVAQSAEDLVMQNKMQRRLGQLTGTCFQRCVGMDAFKDFVAMAQAHNWVIGGTMTDVKGDRSKAPHQQADPDLFLHVVDRTDEGITITGAKAHQTGCVNAHWLLVMPTIRLGPEDADYAVVGAVPVEAPGVLFIYGRQPCDTRSMEEGALDTGNATYAGQEALVVFDNVFIPWKHVFMDGEHDFAAMLVERFASFHRRSYVCKSGVGDVLIGAAGAIADYNGVPKASHIRDKLVEMTHLNETIYATGIASSYQAYSTKSGGWQCDDMLANVCKHHVTKMPYELGRIAQDLAGGSVVTLPSEQDLRSSEIGPLLEKYLQGREGVPVEDRWKILRLIENMTLGRNAVGYLTESIHGAGSPQTQRVQIARQMQLEYKKRLAKRLAGIPVDDSEPPAEPDAYFKRIWPGL
jgi:4-hydroxybutyryl-CoA dehydratase/vinylacetyl-CoA-Delta-isomerase